MKHTIHIFLLTIIFSFCITACSSDGSFSDSTGEGGSLARFTIIGDHLYTVSLSELSVYNLEDAVNPKLLNTAHIGRRIETIYPYQDKLFIGSQTGIYIYDVSNPEQPEFLSDFRHAQSCDPVVTDGMYAYVTLREGLSCVNASNQLDIIDVRDLENPQLVKTYPMTRPAGLGIDGNTLFICDDTSGLKVFDVSDKLKIDENLLDQVEDFVPLDVIPIRSEKRLIVAAEDGLYQFDYHDRENLKLLSNIEILP